MNAVIELLMKHRSIRKFKNEPVPREMLETIVQAAQMASSSSHMQAYSVIHVSDPDKKSRLSALAGNQAYVKECPVFLVWCADLYRLKTAAAENKASPLYLGTTENLIVSLVDTALAAQNAAIAAESLGLGVVYIGGIRNQMQEAAELLGLPEYTVPVFGMCIGYPDQTPMLRPRLPLESVLHHNTYDPAKYERSLQQYDETMRRYMLERTQGRRDTSWTEAVRDKLGKPARMHMKPFLASRKFWEHDGEK